MSDSHNIEKPFTWGVNQESTIHSRCNINCSSVDLPVLGLRSSKVAQDVDPARRTACTTPTASTQYIYTREKSTWILKCTFGPVEDSCPQTSGFQVPCGSLPECVDGSSHLEPKRGDLQLTGQLVKSPPHKRHHRAASRMSGLLDHDQKPEETFGRSC